MSYYRGVSYNKSSFHTDIKWFITGRRYETTTLHNMLQGFSLMECDWLAPDTASSRAQHRVSATDVAKRRELLEEYIFWYFDSFLIPLLKVRRYSVHPRVAKFDLSDHVLHNRVFRVSEEDSVLPSR